MVDGQLEAITLLEAAKAAAMEAASGNHSQQEVMRQQGKCIGTL